MVQYKRSTESSIPLAQQLGQTSSLPNDNTPGVGQDDYTRWRSNFGSPAGSGSGTAAAVLVPGADRERSREAKCDGQLVKPVDLSIRNLLLNG